MGDLSEHFDRSEFACKCGCGQDTVDAELIKVLESVRDYFKTPIRINSGNRCKEYNKKIGGSDKSQHLLGKAADIYISVDLQVLFNWLNFSYPDRYGIGNYSNFTHIDVRSNKARW